MPDRRDTADYPGAFIPFDKPVGLVPTVAIDASPTVQLCVNETWLPYLVTCLKALSRPETWDDSYDNAVIAASEFAALISNISDGCGIVVPSVLCISGSFEDLDYGFEVTPGSQCSAVYTPGTGWVMCCNATPQGFLQIRRNFGTTTIIRGVKLTLVTTVPYLINYDITLLNGSTFTSIASASAVTGPTINIDVSGLSEPAEALYIHVQESIAGCAADTVLTDWSICYTGAFPLSVPPDTWEVVVDFTTGDHGFAAVMAGGGGGPRAYYTAGVGWTQWNASSPDHETDCRFTKTLSASHRFTSVEVFVSNSAYLGQIYLFNFAYGPFTLPAGGNDTVQVMDLVANVLRMDFVDLVTRTSTITVSKMIFRGLGTAPTDLA